METIRVMNRPDDYAEANINQDHVEVWEDGVRNNGNKGCLEWWYFDCDTEDGIKIGVNFSLYQVLTGAFQWILVPQPLTLAHETNTKLTPRIHFLEINR